MNNLTPLTRPLQSQVTIDPTAKDCPSEGFNYPTFLQLNKEARVQFSQPFSPESSTSYRLFATASIKGWFVAITVGSPSSSELIFSSLEHLRSEFTAAKEENQELFTPKRSLPLAFGKANIVTFACHDARLLVGFEQGAIAIYDTAALFTPGSGDVQPLKITQFQSGPLRQIVPNPGTEQNLSSLVVVVGDGKVALLDMQLEPQGGWVASDSFTQPTAAAWSPKGKHLAIGLQTGDILTFSLINKSVPHKHIPPTANGTLVSLNWLGPGHTFRTSYSAQSDTPPRQHIITLDIKSSTATYVAPDHPFPSFDRNQQNAYTLYLPRWDEDASGDGNKSLTIVGDVSSVDLEILGNIGSEWYRQSQENPLTLPLDKSMDDTMLLALDVDLIDISTGTPVIYAYLNDGTLQGWQVKHSKHYVGMVSAQGSAFSQPSVQTQDSDSKDSDMGGLSSTTETPPFAQLSSNNTPFGQQTTSSFGQQQSSTFGQPSQNASVFGQSVFGQSTPSGSSSAFSSSSSPFGQASQANTAGSSFGSSAVKTSSSFGAFGNVSGGVFGSGSSSGGAFSNLNSGTTNVFGQGSFGANNGNSGSASPSHSLDMTREASMSDSTNGFGGMSLGSATSTNSNAVNSMFGTFGAAPVGAPNQSAFGGIVQPATGFGAFNNLKPSNSFDLNKPTPTTSAFSVAPQASTSSGFGQSGFASPAFGKSSFGQPAFGKPSLGISPSTSAGGFAAFSNAPSAFGSPPAPATSVFGSPENKTASSGTASGFSAFASGGPTSFGSALEASKSADGNKNSGGGFSAFTSSTPTTFTSTLGAANTSKPSSGGFSAFATETPATFGTIPVASTTPENTPKASASAGGFASFASSSSPSFGTALKTSESSARTSVFGTPTGSKSLSSTAESLFASPTVKSASFGDSALTRDTTNTPGGSPQPAFAVSPPSSPEPGVRASSSPHANDSTPSTPRMPPAPSLNAFSNIQTTPSTFKPAAGFGAFGSATTPPTSPFFKKPDDKPPVSAFSNILSQKSPTTPAGTPTFGSPSALGGPKSVFAPVSPPSPTVLKSTTSAGFGAFSGATGGFSAFAGPKKSFSELLKTGDADPVKPSTSLASSISLPEDLREKTTPKASASLPSLHPMSSDSSGKREDIAKDDKLKTPKSAFSVPPATSPGNNSVDKGKPTPTSDATVFDDDDYKKSSSTNEVVSSGTISDEPSYGIISGSSAASSFVDVKAEQESDGDTDEGADDEGDDVNAFLSEEEASSDGSYEDQESAEESSAAEDSEARDLTPPEPAAIPLPISRSPSSTPQPEVPTIEVSPSPPSEERYSRSSSLSPAREPSTTPPGTPAKEPKPLMGSSPSPSGNASNASPFGIGLGRPSTRPARSSPLANAVLSGHDDDDEDKPKSSQPPAVAPKTVFNVLPVKVQMESSEGQSSTDKRPKTPPLLSTMGGTSFFGSATLSDASKPSTAPTESSPAKANTPVSLPFSFQKPAAMASPPSVFGKPPQTLTPGPSPSPPMQNIQRPASTPVPTHPTLFATPPPTSASSPSSSVLNVHPVNSQTPTTTISLTSTHQGPVVNKPSTLPQFPTLPKGTSGPSSSIGPSLFAPSNQPSTTLKAPPADLFASSPAFSTPQKPPAATTAQVALEEGMQKECVYSVTLADKELEEMNIVVNSSRKKFEEIGTSRGGSRNRRDPSDPSKWGLSDLAQFGQVLRQYEGEFDNLEAQNEMQAQVLREIRSNMLKAGTRREEIARFSRAKTDQEFAKIMKARTLGPEHSETQMQLRKYIRLAHDRVQNLETGLQEKKKKLAESISGRPSFKAPSLDTINRSYQNIDRIIRNQSDQVSDLTARISKLNARDVTASPQRDARLGDSGSKRPYDVTPDVAVTTAAALNAERSAQRLKKALLAVRKEPILNAKAASAPNINMLLNTPQKSSEQHSAFPALLPPSPTPSSSASMLDWTSLPEDKFNPSASPLPQSRRGGGGQRKHPSVPLKRSTGPSEVSASTAKAPSFDWGPLPTFPSPGTAKTTTPTAFVPISTAIKTVPNK